MRTISNSDFNFAMDIIRDYISQNKDSRSPHPVELGEASEGHA